MPLKIPADALILHEPRITLIRAVKTLHDRLVQGEGGLTDQVKRTMREKGCAFAESSLAVAALTTRVGGGAVDPRKLHALIAAGKLTLEQFFQCVSVRREPLEKFLPGQLIDELVAPATAAPGTQLVTEFKPGLGPDADRLGDRLGGLLERAMKEDIATTRA